MNKQQAQQIIRDTFESSFDKNDFTGFIKNLLNGIEDAPFTYQGNYIPDAYKQYIKKLERIGKFSDGENSADILVITLQKETSLERARTMQRNFVAWYLNGSRGGEMKDAALAAFVSPGEEDWRFSLVKMDYKFEKTKSGRMKVKEEFTPARRWSFLVGANEKSHTAQSRLVNILANDEQAPTLKEIGKSFDIEIVTKEFFLKYRELFLRTKEELDKIVIQASSLRKDFEAKGVDTVNFAKKLLGQIIFLYFLQKKGWFGVGRDDDWGMGSKHFLRALLDKKHSDYKNFYNDILEPLFYEALRIDRSHVDGYYSRFDCKIPFLNGGLFDPIGNYDWVHTDIIIPDKLFSNNVRTKEGDIGSGILDVFDRYNFTVKEDEPLEKEVAIDPELLGKSYEKFNAIRPDNYDEFRKALMSGKKGEENKFNKKFGVYYTPREIVHYMCQQSLINYLATEVTQASSLSIPKEDIEALIHIGEQVSEIEARVISEGSETRTYSHKLPESIRNNAALIDEKLADITVCDPAVGSGAFPVGMMSEIVRARNVLSTFIHRQDACATAYDFKRRCIEHSLYGVDIDPGAVEIAKLRLWLSLVVDEDDLPAPRRIYYIYAILCNNDSIYIGQTDDLSRRWKDHFDGKVSWTAKFTPIEIIHYEKFSTRDEAVAREKWLKTGFGRKWIKREKHAGRLSPWNHDMARQAGIKNIKPLPNLDYKIVCGNSLLGVEKDLFNANLFSELEKLKPLFFNETNPTKKQEYKKQIDELINEITSGHAEFDFEVYFSEVFHNKGGFDVVIANPPYVKEYVNRAAFNGLRNSPYYQGKMDLWYLFSCRGIDVSRNNSGIVTFIAQNNWVTSHGASKMRNKVITDAQILCLIDFSDFKIFEAGIQTMVMLFRRNTDLNSYSFDYRRIHGNNLELKDVISLLNKEDNAKAEYLTPTIIRSNFIDKTLTFSNSDVEQILEKIASAANFHLDPNKEVAQGIVPNPDVIGASNLKKIPKRKIAKYGIKTGDGVFVVQKSFFKRLNRYEKTILRPLYEPTDLSRYFIKNVNTKEIIYTTKTNDNNEMPNLLSHLWKFKDIMDERRENKNGRLKYYHLHWPRDNFYFKPGPKILSIRKCARPTYTYTEDEAYVMMSINVIRTTRINTKYLIGLLNSSLITFWLKHRGKMQGTNYQIDKEPILSIPIVKPENNQQMPIINLIDKILAKKECSKDTDYEENQIDQLIYKLYGLTQEEIKIVEGE